MLLILFISSALLIGPSLQASPVESQQSETIPVDSGRQSRQYWPGFVPHSYSYYYNQPIWPPYFPRYYQPYHAPAVQSPYHFGYSRDEENSKFQQQSVADETVESLFNEYMNGNLADKSTDEEIESRQNGGINQAISNFPVIRNPNAPNYLNMYDGCKDPNGLSGICLPAPLCRRTGGRPSAGCGLTSVCCVNAINSCGGTASMNNTYWQSPSTVSAGNCDLTINVASNIFALFRPICQVRINFNSLTLEQPAATSVCTTDTFTVRGATGSIPTICGKNDGQHMYLTPVDKKTNIVLRMAISTAGTITRSWNIRVILLPCGSNSLAPPNCLQYFTQPAGSVQSFNYDDIATTPAVTRQLANQDYQICFRRELVNNQAAVKACFTPCRVNSNGAKSFSITGNAAGGLVPITGTNCQTDFLLIQDGIDPAQVTPAQPNPTPQDRYCGTTLNPDNTAGVQSTVCTTVRDFNIYYRTNAAEAAPDSANVGFCLDFDERAN